MNTDDVDSSPPKCCCCRIDKAAKILAWISIVLLFIGFGLYWYWPPAEDETYMAKIFGKQTILLLNKEKESKGLDASFFACLIFYGIYIFVIIGCKKRKAAYFLPYLIVTAIAMIFGLISLIYVALTGPLPGFLILLLAYAINFWIYSVFYKAYRFIKEEQQNGGQNQLPIIYQKAAENS